MVPPTHFGMVFYPQPAISRSNLTVHRDDNADTRAVKQVGSIQHLRNQPLVVLLSYYLTPNSGPGDNGHAGVSMGQAVRMV